MTRWFRNGSRWGGGAWAVIALAVALRLSVLPGYMITADPQAVTVVMCTANGAVSKTIAADQGHSTPDGDGSDHPGKASVCAFAMAGVALAAPDLRIVVAVPRSAPPVPLTVTFSAPGRGLAAPPPPSTGPPFSI